MLAGERTCALGAPRGDRGLDRAVLALVRRVELVDRLVPGRPDRRPREGPARALCDLLDVGQPRRPVVTSWNPWFACIHWAESARRSSPGSRARSARASRAKRCSACSSSARSSSVIRSAAIPVTSASSSARRRNVSHISWRRSVRTRKPRFGSKMTSPSASSRRNASRSGVRLTPYWADSVSCREHRARRELAEDDRLLDRERDLVGLRASRLHPFQCTAASGPGAAAMSQGVKRIQSSSDGIQSRGTSLRSGAVDARKQAVSCPV